MAALLLTGEYFPNIDQKGRMNFPSKLRDGLGERFYITRWMEPCLVVFSEEEWELICKKIKSQPFSLSGDAQRYLSTNACLVEPDKQGRVSIPQNLRERAGITKEVAVIGVLDRAEIWDKERWLTKSDEMNSELFSAKMLELGI